MTKQFNLILGTKCAFVQFTHFLENLNSLTQTANGEFAAGEYTCKPLNAELVLNAGLSQSGSHTLELFRFGRSRRRHIRAPIWNRRLVSILVRFRSI